MVKVRNQTVFENYKEEVSKSAVEKIEKAGLLDKIQVKELLPQCRKLVSTMDLPKEEWLKWRQKGLGGSDVASIFEINPFSSSLSLYFDKTEKIKPEAEEEENLPAEMGTFLEPFCERKFLRWGRLEKGWDIQIIPYPYILQHKSNDLALANLDGIFRNPENGQLELVEYKTTSERNYQNWTDENLPEYYYLQIQWYLYVTGLQKCYLAFMIGNNLFNVTEIDRNDEVIDQLVEGTTWWWNEFVAKKVAPAPDGSKASSKTLEKMYKVVPGKEVILDGMDNVLEQIINLKKEIKIHKDALESQTQLVKAKMKDAELAKCNHLKVTWKSVKKKGHYVKDSEYRMFRISKNKGEMNVKLK